MALLRGEVQGTFFRLILVKAMAQNDARDMFCASFGARCDALVCEAQLLSRFGGRAGGARASVFEKVWGELLRTAGTRSSLSNNNWGRCNAGVCATYVFRKVGGAVTQ